MDALTIAVVDHDNRFVRWASKVEVHRDRLPHRSVHTLVFDASGRLVVQQRHSEKLTYASHWDLSCCGHVERDDYPQGPDDQLDEVYLEVAHRELTEELGVDAHLTLLGRFAPEEGLHYEHFHLFEGAHDGPYTLQVEEVQAIRRLTPAEFDAMAADPDALLTPLLIRTVAWLRTEGRFKA